MARVVRTLNRVTLGAAIVALLFVTLGVLSSVIVRYFSLGSFYGVDELSRFGAIWLVFLGVPAAMQYRQHIAFDTFLQALTPRPRLWAELMVQLLSGAFLIVFTWQGVLLAQQTHEVKSPGLELPMSLAYAALPIGGGLMALNLLVSIVGVLGDLFAGSIAKDSAIPGDEPDHPRGGTG